MDDIRAPGVLDSDPALVRLALAGDEAAFARIVRLHRAGMVRTCFLVTLETAGALDAVASAWPVAWDRLATLEDPARLGPWLCSIAAGEAREVVLFGARGLPLGRLSEGPEAVTRPDAVALARDAELAGVLAELRVEDRVLLALRDVAGLTPDELGRATGHAPWELSAGVAGLAGRLGEESGEGLLGDRQLGDRLRSFADVPVGHVHIDAVARTARITRHDRRNRVLSLVLAAIVAAPFIAVPYLGQSGAWPVYLAARATPPPAPSMAAPPAERESPR